MIDVLKNLWLNFQRTTLILLGLLLFVIGLITFPLPLPIGLPLLVISTVILLRNSSYARLGFRWLKKWAAEHPKPRIIYNFLKKLETIVYKQKINLIKQKSTMIEKTKKAHSQNN